MADEKPILLHGYRYVDPETEFSPIRDTWFLLKHTANGPKITEIFRDLPKTCLNESRCALIGSSLYVLGGMKDRFLRPSDLVRRLDTKNPTDGWKTCKPLAFPFRRPMLGVTGDLIYLLPLYRNDEEECWGCCYDTSSQRSWIIKPPPPYCSDCNSPIITKTNRYPSLCAAFDFDNGNGNRNRGAIVPISSGGHVFLYNPDQNSWKSFCHSKLPNIHSHSLCCDGHAVLNGLLYFSFRKGISNRSTATSIYVYDIHKDQLLLDMTLPGFKNQDPERYTQRFMVATDDYKLSFLWYSEDNTYQSNKMTLYIAKVELLPYSKSFIVHSEEKVAVKAATLLNCLQLSTDLSGLVDNDWETKEVKRESRKRIRSSKSSSRRKLRKQKEGDCCKEEIQKLRKEVQELKALILFQHRNNQP